ncbi:hypothetical protein GBAR_LOCUS1660 [Geodia barretti]|uniref:Uncharacterized protein n=1 Tax=Geodia barretti TaxID=519541 RepID=A0AA35W1F5_GEOBA|nr:hypothetical protein GBAR_LOCUS1660 [Geodia barretti]
MGQCPPSTKQLLWFTYIGNPIWAFLCLFLPLCYVSLKDTTQSLLYARITKFVNMNIQLRLACLDIRINQ